jgi:hypothetical protein
MVGRCDPPSGVGAPGCNHRRVLWSRVARRSRALAASGGPFACLGREVARVLRRRQGPQVARAFARPQRIARRAALSPGQPKGRRQAALEARPCPRRWERSQERVQDRREGPAPYVRWSDALAANPIAPHRTAALGPRAGEPHAPGVRAASAAAVQGLAASRSHGDRGDRPLPDGRHRAAARRRPELVISRRTR